MSFAKDNKKGKKAEILLIDFLAECGVPAKLNTDPTKYSFYDIIADNGITFEVKFDHMFCLTGNIAIEHHNSKLDKPSGITISTADWWVYAIYESKVMNLYFSRRVELLFFMEHVEPHKKIISAGDNNANLYIYKKDDILNRALTRLTVEKAKDLFGVN